jgi:muramoyltetrapeptide carboxypeptidase
LIRPLPKKLQVGDIVAIVSPARWPKPSYTQALIAALERQGLVPMPYPKELYEQNKREVGAGQLAGTDAQRAEALNAVISDKSVKAVFFPRAGTGSYRILDRIDYQAIRSNPKIIIGFSDVDILLHAINAKTGLITFRGPLGVNFASQDFDPRTEKDCFDLLFGKLSQWTWTEGKALRLGNAEGELVGGNLAVLNANIGTAFEVDTTNKIVVIEECDELLFRLDRFLYQASKAGKFAKAKAVIVGTIENMLDGEQHDGSGAPFGKDLDEMLLEYVPDNIPLVSGLPLGHGAYLSSHPIGARMSLSVTEKYTKMQLAETIWA